MSESWTEGQTRALVQMWNAGAPTSLIAANLGRTANACRRKAQALGLPGQQRRRTTARMRRDKKQAPPPGTYHAINPGGCQYIHGDPKRPGWRYCGEATPLGQSWCEAHYSVVYTPHTLKPREAMSVGEIMRTRRAA